MLQIKEQDKTPEEQLREVEISNLPEKKNEFRVVIVRTIQDLGNSRNGGTDTINVYKEYLTKSWKI